MAVKNETILKVVIITLAVFLLVLCGYIVHLNRKIQKNVQTIETVTTQDNKYTQFYYEREFKELKKENKELYDSLKSQQDYITSLSKFNYKVHHKVDTVIIEKNHELPQEVENLADSTYCYSNETDSLSYNLLINSKLEPNWYALDVDVKDEFTIVNKQYSDGRLTTSIESGCKGEISDITAWQKSTKKKWYQRFAVGPAVTVGYDPINRNAGVVIGISATWNILGK